MRDAGIWELWGTRDRTRTWNPTDIPLLPNTNKIPSANLPFLDVEQQNEGKDRRLLRRRKKGRALTFQNCRARVVLGVTPD